MTKKKRTKKRKSQKSRLGDLLLEGAARRKNQSQKSVPVVRIHPLLHQHRPREPRAQLVIIIQGATRQLEVVQAAKILILQHKARHGDALARRRGDDLPPEEGRRLVDVLYLEEGLDRQTIVTRALIGNL